MLYYWLWLVLCLLMGYLCYDALPYVVDRHSQFLMPIALTLAACSVFVAVYGIDFLGMLRHRIALKPHSGGQEALAVGMPIQTPVMQKTAVAWSGEGEYEYQFNLGGIYAEAMSRGKPITAPFIDGTFDVLEDRKVSSNTTVRKYRKNRLTGAAVGGMTEIENREPTRAPSVAADVLTPMYQSLFTGFLGLLIGAFIGWKAGNILDGALIGGIGGMALVWFVQLGLARKLLWKIETITSHDWDGDDTEGEPDTSHPMVVNAGQARQQVSAAQANTNQQLNLAGLVAMLNRLYVVGTSESANGVNPGSAAWTTFDARRQILLDLGVLEWKNPARHQSGTVLQVDQPTAVGIINEHVNDLPIIM